MGKMEQIGDASGFWGKIPKSIISFGFDNEPETEKKEETLERKEAVRVVVEQMLSLVEKKYGTGANDGENPKFYHNLVHTQNAREAAQKIAELAAKHGKIFMSEVELAEIAAAGHDLEQDLGSGENERTSARMTREEMGKTGVFSNSDIEKVEKMELATTVSFEGGVMKQSATEEYLTQVIADADLSALGQPSEQYWATAQALLKEIKNTDTPSVEDQLVWAKGQIAFLSNHEFYTDEAKELFPHKEENIAFAKEQVAALEAEISQVK
ncbi:MAG: hypothetical protein M0P64_00350 [Candidatus Pacebacteria bacterium]|jgi:predicted metal-dependent HD superfamily phosphohydrolase|nr:hypothetical protein [Candidatus Paceibacterota bacterium]